MVVVVVFKEPVFQFISTLTESSSICVCKNCNHVIASECSLQMFDDLFWGT